MPIEEIVAIFRGVDKLTPQLKKIKKSFTKFRAEFLTFMFAGMQLQRIFERIASSAIQSFQSIMNTVVGTATAITQLSAHWEFLKFTIGNAINTVLEPLIPHLVGIISWLADWIEQHPKLTTWILILVGVLGTLMMIIGQVGLFINGLVVLMSTPLGAALKLIWGLFVSLGSALLAFFMTPVGLVILGIGLLILAFIALWNKSEAFRNFWIGLWNGIKNVASIALDWLHQKIAAFIDLISNAIKKFMEFTGLANIRQPSVFGKRTNEAFPIKKQFGGIIPQTGEYMLHAGERVIPANQSTVNGGITVNINGAGDSRAIASEVMKEIKRYITVA